MVTRGPRSTLGRGALTLAGLVLCSCSSHPTQQASDPQSPEPTTRTSRTPGSDPLEDPVTPGLVLVDDKDAPVDPDLQRLAKRFVKYAIGNADTFPYSSSLSMSIGGQPVKVVDDVFAAIGSREIWSICPDDWEVYGAVSCPVDVLVPINNAVLNHETLVYSAEFGDVTCAPPRDGPLPPGRLVVLRPSQERRSCTSDFALALLADEHGRLQSIDFTLAEP